MSDSPYSRAQSSLASLKSAIYQLLEEGPEAGLRNVEIGRSLGIYEGHEGHEGHIPRTLLAMMEKEEVVEQDDDTGRWSLQSHMPEE